MLLLNYVYVVLGPMLHLQTLILKEILGLWELPIDDGITF